MPKNKVPKIVKNISKAPTFLTDTFNNMNCFTAASPLKDYPERPKTPDARSEYLEATLALTAKQISLELVSAAAYQQQAAERHWNGGIQRWGLND